MINARRLPGKWEQATNYVQRTLLTEYDKWSEVTNRALANALKRGATRDELAHIVNGRLSDLEGPLIQSLRAGIMRTSSLSLGGPLGAHIHSPDVLKALADRIAASDVMVKTQLIPNIGESIVGHLSQQGPMLDSVGLRAAMDLQRSKIGWQAGTAWQTIFEVQKTALNAHEQEGGEVVPVRWALDPNALHCHTDPKRGTFGCPEMAGVYMNGIDSLPTLPAANVTCGLNCRCHLELSWDKGKTFGRITS